MPRRPHKPVIGNLALAAANLLVNAIRAWAILTAWALDRPGNLLNPRRYL